MAIYSFKIPGIVKVNAQIAGEVCASLENSEAGLSPASLVEASRPEDAPLHNEFEWDDAKAAEQFREHQASKIIRNLTVTVEESESQPRAFVNLKSNEVTGNYVSFTRVLNNDDWKEKLLASARMDMQAFIAKYKVLKELAGVVEEMQKII